MITVFLAATSCLWGMAALALAMPKHWEQIGRENTPPRSALRLFGVLALLIAFVFCGTYWDYSRGAVVWAGMVSLAGIVTILALAFWPRAIGALLLIVLVLAGFAVLVR
ncbi:DUF3325 domain-containing protein [Pacificimonas sp. ICDLI1SI03]